MCSDRRDAKRDLDAILESLVDAIAATPAEEIAEEARAGGEDLNAVADEVKGSLLAGVKRFEQRKLQAAREAYRLRAGSQGQRYALPPTPEARRNQLFSILNAKPNQNAILTAQHRNFENLTDQDIQSSLEDLLELGVFDDLDKGTPE